MRTKSWSLAALLFDEVELLDVAGPLEVFSSAGRHWNWRPFKVYTVAAAAGKVSTRGQLAVVAEHSFETCPTVELLLVPGGYGARRALRDARTVEFVRRAGTAAERVFCVGNGALLVAKAKLARGAELAVPKDAVEMLTEIEPSATAKLEQRLCESGKLLSAPATGSAVELALAGVARVLGAKQAAAVAGALGLEAPEPPLTIQISD